MNAEALRRSASFNGSPVAGGSATSSTSAAERRGSGVYQNFNEVRAAQDRVQRGVGTSREHMGKVTPARSGPVVITTSPDGKTTYRAESSSSSRERSAGAAEIKSPGERTSGGGSEIKTPGERTAGSSSTTERSGEIRQPGEKTVKEKAAEINEKDKAEREAKAAAEKAAAERKVTAEKAAAEKAAAEKKQAEKAGKRHK
ncbi:MAG: hypothetical protein IPI81_09880 [Flavobacteriales bacterium]|nr:hypothetical protein [Flavobacteriales bacterium]